MINERTSEFIPISQYLLYPFESAGGVTYLNSKSKPLVDKMMPDSLISIKISRKHIDTVEMKDRIVMEAIENLTMYLAAHSRKMFFPEMTIGLSIVLRKFRKNTS